MASAPATCPTCGMGVPSGASRCPGCGRVFGEENRCPQCHAIAAVIERRGKTVCAACGKPRLGTVTLEGKRTSKVPTSAAARESGTSAMLTRARGRTQRGLGIAALTAGIVAAAVAAALVSGSLGLGLAVALGVLLVGLGAFSIRAGAQNMEAARRLDSEAHHTTVRELARERGGVLSASGTAEVLGVSVEEADAILTSMVGDGSEVDLEVDDDGVVTYVFHAERSSAAKVRVETEPEADELAAESTEDASAERRRGA